MEYDRKDLKIQALLEKVSSLTTQYENNAADLRVEVTVLSEKVRQLEQQLESFAASDEETDVLEENSESSV